MTDLISDLTSTTETQARKALCALRGLVKLQALVRGQLVRRQANATLRRMQALVDAQSRLRAQRARMLDADHATPPAAYQRRSPHHPIPMRRSSYVRPTRTHLHDKLTLHFKNKLQPRHAAAAAAAEY